MAFMEVTHDLAAAEGQAQTALDLSTASGVKFETVQQAMISAIQGNVSGLEKLGVGMDDYAKQVLKAVDAHQRLLIL